MIEDDLSFGCVYNKVDLLMEWSYSGCFNYIITVGVPKNWSCGLLLWHDL